MVDADWQQLGAVLGVIGSALVVLRWLWTVVPRLYKKLRHNMFGIGDLKTDMKALAQQVQVVVNEMRPNGGASVRDSLNRIELRQVTSEELQKAILSDMDVGVFRTDTRGDFVWVNRKYLRMTGRAPDEVKGSGWVNTVANGDRERVRAEWNQAINADREFESEFMIITPDDNQVLIQVRTYKMMDPVTGPLGFLGMMTPLCEVGRDL